jgi:hypothetical protein
MDPRRRRAVRYALLPGCFVVCSVPAQAAGDPGHKFDGYGFVSGYYDDNVFSYSDEDRLAYESGTGEAGKFPIAGLSDFVTTIAARGDYDWSVRRHSMWRARALVDGTLYADNSDRNNYRFGASMQRVLRNGSVNLSVAYMPSYYLRELYWRPMPERPAGVTYAAARYATVAVDTRARMRLGSRVDGLVEAGVTNRNYESPFDERDNNTYSGAGGVEVQIARGLTGACMAVLDVSKARGADSPDPEAEDISNSKLGGNVEFNAKMSRRLRFIQSVEYGHQVYSTKNPSDAAHYDRRDDEVTSTSRIQMVIPGGWQPECYFAYRGSWSNTTPGATEFGQYTGYRVGLQLTRYF